MGRALMGLGEMLRLKTSQHLTLMTSLYYILHTSCQGGVGTTGTNPPGGVGGDVPPPLGEAASRFSGEQVALNATHKTD